MVREIGIEGIFKGDPERFKPDRPGIYFIKMGDRFKKVLGGFR